jgi:4-amino-4-deoxy-L-arabinose transferase-like glycosyltransferase
MSEGKSLAIATLAVLVYAWASLDGLSRVPPVSDDEVWIASSAHKLATEGVLGSDLMKGYFGGERHTYHHMPLYPVVLALFFRGLGTSAATIRLLPAACGLLVLLMVLLLGRRLGGPRLGALAMTLILLVRVSAAEGPTGILLFDVARIGRYDIMVPVFGLAALLVFPSSGRGTPARWLGVGALVALSALAHAYGAFLLVGLLAVMIWGRRGTLRSRVWLVLVGFSLAAAPWIWFVVRGWADFLGQLAIPGGRFELLAPSFYLGNLLQEADRIRALTGPLWLAVGRPGLLAVVLGLPAALLLLLRSPAEEDAAAREVAGLFAIQAALFAVLLHSKRASYAIALWPFVVLLLAFVVLRLWNASPRGLPRLGMVALLSCVAGDGILGLWQRHAAQAGMTSYDEFADRLREVVPRGTRVLGLPRFWLGLQENDYRTWAVPFDVARTPEAGVSLRQALEQVDPEIVLVDADIAAAFAERAGSGHPHHRELVDVEAFFAARKAVLVRVLDDPTYGPVKVYRLARAPATASTPFPPG